MKQFVIFKEEKKKWLHQNGYLMKEKNFQLGSHTLLQTRFSKVFMRKFKNFTNDKVKVIIILNTQKIQFLFNNKDKVKHHTYVIYSGICSCSADHIGETIKNSLK